MEFGNLNIITQQFTRKVTNPKGQDYEGIKFRRWNAKKAIKDEETGKETGDFETTIKETFTFSDKLFESLNLNTYACVHAVTSNGVFLLIVDDQDEVKPEAKFMRRSTKKTGEEQGKTGGFSHMFLVEDLTKANILKAGVNGNQYIKLEDAGSEFTGIPSVVHGIYKLDVDTSVEDDEEGEGKKEVAEVSAKENF